jgi:hypothetical protein
VYALSIVPIKCAYLALGPLGFDFAMVAVFKPAADAPKVSAPTRSSMAVRTVRQRFQRDRQIGRQNEKFSFVEVLDFAEAEIEGK